MLLAAFIVPTTIAVVVLFLHSYARERAGIERASQYVARALMQAVDRELSSAPHWKRWPHRRPSMRTICAPSGPRLWQFCLRGPATCW